MKAKTFLTCLVLLVALPLLAWPSEPKPGKPVASCGCTNCTCEPGACEAGCCAPKATKKIAVLGYFASRSAYSVPTCAGGNCSSASWQSIQQPAYRTLYAAPVYYQAAPTYSPLIRAPLTSSIRLPATSGCPGGRCPTSR